MQPDRLCALALASWFGVAACGEAEGPPDPTPGSPSASAGSGGASAGSGGASAGSGGASAGSGGASAGSGGASAGSGGASAGSGGAGGPALVPLASCDPATAEDHTGDPSTSVVIASGAFAYAPPCIKVKKGASVVLPQSGSHPLRGMTKNGSQPNPIHAAEAAGPATLTVTFPDGGSYGYHCNFHGSDAPAGSSGMSGAVYVVD
ncbi:MAG: hypothetical protein IT374_02530 [Polyangiaceae bacterium]|nr:hypothetical protein [Polyangiaceae bacterium]